jgi:hypothetical protein
MSEEFDKKLAASSDFALETLGHMKDALCRNAHREALRYLGDALAAVQNEIDWCYHTDPELPNVRMCLVSLGNAIAAVDKLQERWKREQTKAIIDTIECLTTELLHITKDESRWQAPDVTIDAIEQAYRARQHTPDE